MESTMNQSHYIRRASVARLAVGACLLAAALLHDDVNAALRAPDFGSTELRRIFSKINIYHDAKYDALRRVDMSIPTRVVVKLAGEPDREAFISDPLGSERRGIADMDKTQDKFRAALAPLMRAGPIEQIIDYVAALESCAAQDLMAAAFAQA